MKNRLLSSIMIASLAIQLVACGGADNSASTTAETEPVEEASQEEVVEEPQEETTAENTELANPWRECTEEEAVEACPRLFKAPEGAVVNSWRLMDVENSEDGVPGPIVELDFSMDDMDFTARAQYGASEYEDISGMYYDWDVTDDIHLANWFDGKMEGKYGRHIGDDLTTDLCTWYDIEIGIAYSLSVEANDLEGFDLQAIAEQMNRQ